MKRIFHVTLILIGFSLFQTHAWAIRGFKQTPKRSSTGGRVGGLFGKSRPQTAADKLLQAKKNLDVHRRVHDRDPSNPFAAHGLNKAETRHGKAVEVFKDSMQNPHPLNH